MKQAPIDGIISLMIERPEPYKWRTRIRSIASVVLGAITALFPVGVSRSLDRSLSLAAMLELYVGLTVFLSFVWRLYFDRPEELGKQIPTNSKEHRRRKKEFYDSLDLRGGR